MNNSQPNPKELVALLAAVCWLLHPNSATGAECAPAPSGLIAWWQAEGNALDSVGTNHGAFSGTTFTTGEVGQGFHLNGTGQIMFGTQIGNFGEADFTVEFWIASTNTTRLDALLSKRSICDFANFWNFFLRQDGRVNIEWCGGAAPTFDMDSASALNNGAYHHVAWRRENTNYSLIIDGVVEASQGLPPIDFTNSAALVVGNNPCVNGGPSTRFLGQLDELAIYNRALSLTEIQAIHDAGSFGRCELRSTLSIVALPGAVRLTWTTNATGYLLETNSALTLPASWGVLTSNYNVLNTGFAVTNTIGAAARFYRLRKP